MLRRSIKNCWIQELEEWIRLRKKEWLPNIKLYIQEEKRMDSAAELSFRMESARQWQKNVEEEFKRVDELLKLVAERAEDAAL